MTATATIVSFLVNATTHGQSKKKIKDSLGRSEVNLSEIMKFLDEFKEDRWKSAGLISIGGNLDEKQHEKTALRIENGTRLLKSNTQLSSTNGRLRKDEDPTNVEKKAKEMEIEGMKLEIKHKKMTQKVEDLNRRSAEGP
ncbi:hypothetical protein C0993_006161 [Termitomyces sp. T159_Od127]|nr:hypothetical protein C0993_006161 [Termitomyces sp. T159_Od127]